MVYITYHILAGRLALAAGFSSITVEFAFQYELAGLLAYSSAVMVSLGSLLPGLAGLSLPIGLLQEQCRYRSGGSLTLSCMS